MSHSHFVERGFKDLEEREERSSSPELATISEGGGGHFAWDGDKACLVQTVGFDYAAVEEVIEITSPSARRQAAEVLAEILQFIWHNRSGRRNTLLTATAKFSAIVGGLRPELLGDAEYTEIAQALGVTKQAISKHALNFSDKFGLKFLRSRSAEGREKMRDSMRLSHARRHHSAAEDPHGKDSFSPNAPQARDGTA